jgi:sensor c-di-GMP phosphodiesterase-like protein
LYSSNYKKLLAIMAGVVIAGMPMVVFHYWLGDLIERQGRDEVLMSARRMMSLAETRIIKVAATLNNLAGKAIDSCEPENVEAFRRASFATITIKELSVVGPDGQTLCTDIGVLLGERRIIASQNMTTPSGTIVFDLMQIGARTDDMVRIRLKSGDRGRMLAALMPAEVFLPQVANAGGPLNAHAALTMHDGTRVVASAQDWQNEAHLFTASAAADRYGLTATVAVPRDAVSAGYAGVRALGMIVTGVIGFAIICLVFLVPRDDPIAAIERAMGAGEFVPYYQPVVDIKSGRIRGAEVLVRWRKPDGTVVLPGTFIPLIEASGHILDLTRSLMRHARSEVGDAYRHRPDLRLGFNLAARHLVDEAIVADVREIFERSPIRLSQVLLEITERQPLENLTETRRVIAALQGMGVRIAIDDVGTGHSGLSYILKLGADIIKIDKLFIDGVGSDPNSIKIIETLVDLARNLRMDVVAEGVETFEQVICLRELGVPAAQGFVFAPPLPGSLFLQLLTALDPVPASAGASGSAPEAQPARLPGHSPGVAA